MNADVWAGVAVAALTLAWAVTTTVVARTLRQERARATTDERLANLVQAVAQQSASSDKVHAEMLAQMREDRGATDRRLRWLETNVWTQRRQGA